MDPTKLITDIALQITEVGRQSERVRESADFRKERTTAPGAQSLEAHEVGQGLGGLLMQTNG